MANPPETALPAPRQLLAELVGSIAAIPVEDASTAASANPLRRIPSDQRPLLATLHVLFPALLLPALDLLDRRRVVRWGAAATSAGSPPPLYQIRGGSDRPHVVHLRAWHCTCAFFALRAAAAAAAAATGAGDRADHSREELQSLNDALAHLPLAFTTPPCKHLLACLLANEWAGLASCVVAGEDMAGPETDAEACTPDALAGVVAGVL